MAFGGEETTFGVQIDTHAAAKIPSPLQLEILGPAWVRGDYSQVTFSSAWPADVKNLVLVNNETTRTPPPGRSMPFSAWRTYVNAVYVPKLNQILAANSFVPAIELWNEEDFCRSGYCPYIPPQEYAYLLERATRTIKTKSPATKVVMGGLVSGQIQYLKAVMQGSPGGFAQIDAVGLHPYGTSPDGWCAHGCSGGKLPFGDLATGVTKYQSVAHKPVWVTEIGYGSRDTFWQAEYLRRCFIVLRRLHVPVVIWYAWIDTMNPKFGLMDARGNLKLAGAVFRSFSQ
ncbi:glycosyl hydrolase [Ktedonosporobacter rubrisoli]|uniref:glycosyl hydrolase n=1 Tax=Ktedonosporobacter rubrisoli TaxID=2509675 RepID=UPI0013EE4841|nr:glycosyl hydrolase [Ktedonosporobacter rubrisoli]